MRDRAEEFARLLDSGGTTDDSSLGSLVQLAGALQALPAGPGPDFRAGLRQRLVAVAAVNPPTAPAPAPSPLVAARRRAVDWAGSWRGQRRLALAGASLAVVVALLGVGVAASRSLPGDPFYGVKRASESVQLDLTFGDYARGKRHLQFARTRLHEVRALVSGDRTVALSARPLAAPVALSAGTARLVVRTLHAMDSQVVAGTKDLTRAYRTGGQRDALVYLEAFARQQHSALSAVLPALPVPVRANGQQSLALLEQVDSRVATLLKPTGCTRDCGTGQNGSSGPASPCPCLPGTDTTVPGTAPTAPVPTTSASPSPESSTWQGPVPGPSGWSDGTSPSPGSGDLGGVVGQLFPSTSPSPSPTLSSGTLPSTDLGPLLPSLAPLP